MFELLLVIVNLHIPTNIIIVETFFTSFLALTIIRHTNIRLIVGIISIIIIRHEIDSSYIRFSFRTLTYIESRSSILHVSSSIHTYHKLAILLFLLYLFSLFNF